MENDFRENKFPYYKRFPEKRKKQKGLWNLLGIGNPNLGDEGEGEGEELSSWIAALMWESAKNVDEKWSADVEFMSFFVSIKQRRRLWESER